MSLPNKSNIKAVSLKDIRAKLKISQKEMAKLLGTEQNRISKMETGKEIPEWLGKAIALNRLLEKAGFSYNDLILDLPDPDPTTDTPE